MIIWAAITNNPLSLIGTYTVIMWSFKATRWWYRRKLERAGRTKPIQTGMHRRPECLND